MPEPDTHRIAVYLSEDMFLRIRKTALAERRTVSSMAALLLEAALQGRWVPDDVTQETPA